MSRISAGRRSVGAFVGLGAATLALLSVLQSQLSDLHLFPDMKIAVSLLIGALAALATAFQSFHARSQDEDAAARELDAALAGGATRTVEQRDAIDVGATPDPDWQEHRRSFLISEIEARMRAFWLVCVIGPPDAGVTRAAFEALRATRSKAKLVCPVDANGLSYMLAARDQLLRALADNLSEEEVRKGSSLARRVGRRAKRSFRLLSEPPPVPLVLWLDGLERFVPELDVDELVRFLGSTGPDADPEHSPAVRLVATMRAEDHDRLLAGDDDNAHRARRLLGLGCAFRLSAPMARGCAAAPGEMPAPATVPNPPQVDELRPEYTGRGALVVLSAVVVGLGIWLGLSWIGHHGWTVPPSLAVQQDAISGSLPACETPPEGLQPAQGLREDQDWILPVQSGSCPASDSVSVFRVQSGRLVKVLTEAPKNPTPIWWFRCPVPGRCAISAGGRRIVVVGQFTDPQNESLPIVLFRFHSQEHLLAPALPRLPVRLHPQGQLKLDLSPGAISDLAPGTCSSPAQLCGYPADYVTATLSSTGNETQSRVLLIAGYADGVWYKPSKVLTQAFALQYEANGYVHFDPRPCHRQGGQTLVTVRRPHEVNIGAEMQNAWQPSQDVVCP